MKEKFKIDREKLEKIVNQYEVDIKGKNEEEKEKIEEHYVQMVIECLGTKVLQEAIDEYALKNDARRILERECISKFYSDEECLQMLEGLSNYEIIGDWQHFRTVKSQYLFKLPENMQEMFAKNFAIGNDDARRCLLKLWKEHIETTGIDVKREYSPGSMNSVTIQCHADEMIFMFETLRKNGTRKRCFYVSSCRCIYR